MRNLNYLRRLCHVSVNVPTLNDLIANTSERLFTAKDKKHVEYARRGGATCQCRTEGLRNLAQFQPGFLCVSPYNSIKRLNGPLNRRFKIRQY